MYRLFSFYDNLNKRKFAIALNNEEKLPTTGFDISSEIDCENIDNFFSDSQLKKLNQISNSLKNNASFPKISISHTQLASPILQPRNIIATGLNYPTHNKDVRQKKLVVFPKNVSITSATAPVFKPKDALLDWEIELGIVIKKTISQNSDINENNLKEYIAGFVMANDITDRRYIIKSSHRGYTASKTFPGSLPIGPYFIPIDTCANLDKYCNPKLKMKLTVNSKIKQLDNTKFMIASIYKIIQTILKQAKSKHHTANRQVITLLPNNTLLPGDLILTGTPGGTAIIAPHFISEYLSIIAASFSHFPPKTPKGEFIWKERNSGKYLEADDVLMCEIQNLGLQKFKISAAKN